MVGDQPALHVVDHGCGILRLGQRCAAARAAEERDVQVAGRAVIAKVEHISRGCLGEQEGEGGSLRIDRELLGGFGHQTLTAMLGETAARALASNRRRSARPRLARATAPPLTPPG